MPIRPSARMRRLANRWTTDASVAVWTPTPVTDIDPNTLAPIDRPTTETVMGALLAEIAVSRTELDGRTHGTRDLRLWPDGDVSAGQRLRVVSSTNSSLVGRCGTITEVSRSELQAGPRAVVRMDSDT